MSIEVFEVETCDDGRIEIVFCAPPGYVDSVQTSLQNWLHYAEVGPASEHPTAPQTHVLVIRGDEINPVNRHAVIQALAADPRIELRIAVEAESGVQD